MPMVRLKVSKQVIWGLVKMVNQHITLPQAMNFMPNIMIFAEGCRGHLGKRLIAKFDLDKDADPQTLWYRHQKNYGKLTLQNTSQVCDARCRLALAETRFSGGWRLYHAENNQVTLGMIVDLFYENPNMYPFCRNATLENASTD